MLQKISLKIKIILLSLTGVTLISLFISFFSLFNFKIQEEEIKNKMLFTTVSLSDQISDQFYERYGDVKAFSLHFKGFTSNSREAINYLNSLIKFYGIYDLIIVCDLNGNVLSVNDESAEGKKINSEILYRENVAKLPWFKETVARKYLEDKQKGFTEVNFQDANFNELTEKVYKEKKYGTIFSTLIYNNKGEAIGVISNQTRFTWVESLAVRMYDNFIQSKLKSLQISLINKAGEIILDYRPNNAKNKEIVHDNELLNNINLVKQEFSPAIKVNQGYKGVEEAKNIRGKNIQINAFAPVEGDKMVDELNWKVITQIDENEAYSSITYLKYIFMVCFIIIITGSVYLSIYFSKNLANKLIEIAHALANGNEKLNKTSDEASQTSENLFVAATRQTASLQQSVAAVNEISAMMNKTVEMTENSRNSANENIQKVNQGKEIVNKMVTAMANIKAKNQDIMDQVTEGNIRISEIVKVISEIENKTKVINEIVFQTKLLSFNASVEAARAGEHGRGFSVVAEEVGNLAQMSGSASKEISAMLDNSINKVKSIISQTKTNVETIIEQSKYSMQQGEEISTECSQIFQEIANNSEKVTHIVFEIANSAKEQAKGVEEINHAMHELDSLTQQNNSIAQKSSHSAKDLLSQSFQLEQMANNLLNVVLGDLNKVNKKAILKGNNSPPPSKPIINKYIEKQNSYNKNISIVNNNNSRKNISAIGDSIKEKEIINVSENKSQTNFSENLKKPLNPIEEVPSYNDPRFEDL